ncbi:MAG: hypothetical protein ACYTFI_13600, partial [Planctomycetota bacterium]
DEAVRLAEEAGSLYEEALANGDVLRGIVELEREAKAVADECIRHGADTHAPEDHAEGWSLIGRAASKRAKGEFVGAAAALREALGKLGECRDACANVRDRRVSKHVMIVLAVVIALAAVAILVGWLMTGRNQLGRTRRGSRVEVLARCGPRGIRFYVYSIRPPRRHGGTENGHGVEVIPRTFSPWPQVWGRRELTAIWARRTSASGTPELRGSGPARVKRAGCSTYDGGHRALHDNDRGRSAVSNPSVVLRRPPCLRVSVVRC